MSNETLSQLATKLKEACDKQDWESLKRLDLKINADIRSALESAATEQEKSFLTSYLKSLQKIYALVISQSMNYRKEISEEFRKLNQDKKAAMHYLESSKYFG